MHKKILYFGGQKSGKSILAEKKALELSFSKPCYIATYNSSYDDSEMAKRIESHQKQREDRFITVEEQKNLTKVIEDDKTYIIDCISMWLLNNLKEDKNSLLAQIESICQRSSNIVFVLNDVNSGVIPIDKLSRKYVDLTGIIGQKIARNCDEVYEVKFGIGVQIK